MSRPAKYRQDCRICGVKLSNPSINKTGLCHKCLLDEKKKKGHISQAKPCIRCGKTIKRGRENKTGLCGDCYNHTKTAHDTMTKVRSLKSTERKRQALIAFEESGGNVSVAIEKAGVARITWDVWKFRDADFAAKISEVEEKISDYVEAKLLSFIKANDKEATIFYLKTKAKHRGYFTYATQKVQVEAEIQVMQKTEQEIEGMSDTALIAEIIK